MRTRSAHKNRNYLSQWVDAATGQRTKFTGDELEAAIANKAVITRGAHKNRKLRSQSIDAEEDVPKSFSGQTLQSINPSAGIGNKYLIERIPHLPTPEVISSIPTELPFNTALALKPLKETLKPSDENIPIKSQPICFQDDTVTIDMSFLHCNFIGEKIPIFVFCGRKENAFVPDVGDASLPIILVCPEQDEPTLRAYIKPGVSLLVIRRLMSITHGQYQKLGLINNRRIGAFIAAMGLQEAYGISYALMSDDNLATVYTQESISSWSDYTLAMRQALTANNAVCGSIATISNRGLRPTVAGELGSKLFIFDLKSIHQKLNTTPCYFLPFFPSKAEAIWGEDYYFQLVLKKLFSDKQGYVILNQTQFGLKRAPLKSLCTHTVKKADAFCTLSFEGLYTNLEQLPAEAQSALRYATNTLQQIIKTNEMVHKKALENRIKCSLIIAHAAANGLPFQSILPLVEVPEEAFLIRFKEMLHTVKEHPYLHPYQKEILTQVHKGLTSQPYLGRFDIATGAGKTYIQIYLTIAALLAGTKRPVVIVTPFKQLVQQAYDDYMNVLAKWGQEYPINPAQVIKLDSTQASVCVQTLLINRTLEGLPLVLICCQDSYAKLLDSDEESARWYQNPAVLLIDESQLEGAILTKIHEKKASLKTSFIADLSATLPEHPLFSEASLISYSRTQAVGHHYIAPCVIDRFQSNYSRESVLQIAQALPTILQQPFPTGGCLLNKKGLIFVPNNYQSQNISSEIKTILTEAGVSCCEVNADEPDSKDYIEQFKAYDEDTSSSPMILICKGMAKVGFSDKGTYWVIYLQNGNASDFYQAAGRAMRMGENSAKIAYVLALNDAKTQLLFAKNQFYDESAVALFSGKYKVQRDTQKGIISIPKQTPQKRLADEDSHQSKIKKVDDYGPNFFFKKSPAIQYESMSIEEKICYLSETLQKIGVNPYEAHFDFDTLNALYYKIDEESNPDLKIAYLQSLLDNVIYLLVDLHPKAYPMITDINEQIADCKRGFVAKIFI